MSLKEKLDKINSEIENGLKSKAFDRLRNLIKKNPNNLELRNILAELYYDCGILDSAGKFWILSEPTDDRIKKCVEIYEKSVNYSGHQILREIKFSGDKTKLSEFASTKISELENDSEIKTGYIPKIENKFQKPITPVTKHKKSFEDKMADFWAYFIIGLCIVLFLIGIYSIIKWLFL